MPISEAHIISLMENQDPACVDHIYDRYADSLYGVILRMVKEESLAQDILQDSFVKVWKNVDKYDSQKAKLFTWLLRICKNTAIDKLRSKKTKQAREIQVDDPNVYDHRESRMNIDHIDLDQHLNDLDPKYLEVIDILYFKGFTQQEASDEMGIPLGTIKSRLKIALRELRKVFAGKNLILSWFLCMILNG